VLYGQGDELPTLKTDPVAIAPGTDLLSGRYRFPFRTSPFHGTAIH